MKSSMYYFHVKTKILADFQICISVPLSFGIVQYDLSKDLWIKILLRSLIQNSIWMKSLLDIIINLTKIPIIEKPVHWFAEQTNELVYFIGTSFMKSSEKSHRIYSCIPRHALIKFVVFILRLLKCSKQLKKN